EQTRPGTMEQEVVKLVSPYAVAYRLRIPCLDRSFAHAARAKSGDRLEDAAAGVFSRVDLQLPEHGRRDPSAADLVARKLSFVQDKYIQAGAPQFPGAGRSRRTAADDQDIARIHSCSRCGVASCS